LDQKLTDFFAQGEIILTGANRPFKLDQKESVWLVMSGKVDIFYIPTRDDHLKSSRQYLYSAEAGDVIFGMETRQGDLSFIGVGVYGTEVACRKVTDLFDFVTKVSIGSVVAGVLGMDGPSVSFAVAIERWVASLAEAIAAENPPNRYTPCRKGSPILMAQGAVLRPVKGIHWVRASIPLKYQGIGELSFGGTDDGRLIPFSKSSWAIADSEGTVNSFSTLEMLYRKNLWDGIDLFRDMAVNLCRKNYSAMVDNMRDRFQARKDLDEERIGEALENIADMIIPGAIARAGASVTRCGDALEEAFKILCKKLDIQFCPPMPGSAAGSRIDPVTRLCLASKIRSRDVILRGRWWVNDVGPLLAYLEPMEEGGEKRPVAILPVTDSTYMIHEPGLKAPRPVNDTTAAELHPVAHTFYPGLPNRAITLMDLFKFGIKGKFRDGMLCFALAIFGGLLGMIMPMVTGTFFDSIIPSADKKQLLQYCLGMFAAGLGSGIFELTRSFALLRISSKTEVNMQSAIWDRLLNMPVSFFGKYNVGDLSLRANSINSIYKMISGTTANSILSSVFSVFNFFLLFYYSFKLAILACVFVIITFAVSSLQSWFQIKIQRQAMEIGGRTTSLVLQLIFGIPKLRVAGAEKRGFAVWCSKYVEGRGLAIRSRRINNYFSVFNSLFSVLPQLTIYYFVATYLGQSPDFTTGRFMAFNAAFGAFMSSTLSLGGILISIMGVVPTYERAKSIMDTCPEVDDEKLDPGELSGDIEVSHVTFRYNEDGPVILSDVSVKANPGEFIALVGPSGSGKSTLLRLLLGFEKPESGAVYLDGKNAADLNPHSVRQQFGVVLQNGKVIAGDIFSNIVGANRLTIDDAWEAASMAGLDKDIKAMPMGMHTVISEGGGTFSGGQKQRLLISRALVTKPRIIFFDEATSALDNATQAIVTESLDKIAATRIVIAHRLSTIIHADRIYVMEGGKVIQEGTFHELVRRPGLFSKLVQRQVV
jgi:ATP-binding cassette subfamily C protein